jgi:hypothetical protein
MTSLVHHEIELAKSEMSEKGKRAGLGAGMFGAAGIAAVFGLACLTACAVAALHLVLSVWLSALVVGGGYLLVAGVIAQLADTVQALAQKADVRERAREALREVRGAAAQGRRRRRSGATGDARPGALRPRVGGFVRQGAPDPVYAGRDVRPGPADRTT